MKKHIPNLITCLNLCSGAAGCIYVVENDFRYAIYFVLAAAVFDFFDGFAARWLHVQSAIGKELDSLADVISFGVLPAIYMVMALREQTENIYLPYLGLLVVALSAVRLARFNLDTRQSDKFIGVPTPANAIMLSALSFLPEAAQPGLLALIIITIVCSLLLVAPMELIALKFKGFGWKGNELKYGLILTIVIESILLGLSALPLVIPSYILFSILGNVYKARQA